MIQKKKKKKKKKKAVHPHLQTSWTGFGRVSNQLATA
jgi:DNA-binding protein H-NS